MKEILNLKEVFDRKKDQTEGRFKIERKAKQTAESNQKNVQRDDKF